MAFTAVAARGSATDPFRLAGKEPIHHVPGAQDTHDRLFEYAGDHLGFYGFIRVANTRLNTNFEVVSKFSKLRIVAPQSPRTRSGPWE